MDRRSWPWRKKNSDKVVANADSNGASLTDSNYHHEDQDALKTVNYVQISLEAYTKLTESEDQVKILNEKLSAGLSDVTVKDGLVKQHGKVAEEAVSGWEKAEAEALALKQQLESLTLEKLASDDRASHLDGALKECMRQIRHIKEESEQKLEELVISKSKQWEKVKCEYETKLLELEQELLRASAENEALDRSLQEHSVVIMSLTEEKSQSEAEIAMVKTNIQSCERDLSSMKYELHVVSKELEIRNEERNMSIRSAEAVNKQHLESVKKIAKLEAECQRLRGLVRKKLPGPAALAQMKLEVESLGRENVENKLRRSPIRNLIPNPPPTSEYTLEISRQGHKDEFLTARMFAMEEETKMLKEALAKRNSEMQASRNMCAKTSSKLHAVEAQLQSLGHGRCLPKSNMEMTVERSVDRNSSNPPSLTSMSEDGIDDDTSCAESWVTALVSELANFNKEKAVNRGNKMDISTNLEVMDDFLEMEKLASMSVEPTDATSIPNLPQEEIIESRFKKQASDEIPIASSGNSDFPNEESSSLEISSDAKGLLSQLQKRLRFIFESQAREIEIEKILDDIRCAVQDLQNSLPRASLGSSGEQMPESVVGQQPFPCTGSGDMDDSDSSVACPVLDQTTYTDLDIAVSKIQKVISLLAKEIKNRGNDQNSVDEQSVSKIDNFLNSLNNVLHGKMSTEEFIVDIAHVLSKAGEMYFSLLGTNPSSRENNAVVYVDELSGLDPSISIRSSGTRSCSDSDLENVQEGLPGQASENKGASSKCLTEEIAQLKLEKDNVESELGRCKEILEQTEACLTESESKLSELKAQLASSQKSNSLAETQLKCMAEAYRLLELRVSETEGELNEIKAKAEMLDLELQAERSRHQEALAKCNDLHERLERKELCSSSAAEIEKMKQENDIAAAADKLAECQETIFLLGKQLNALRPPLENHGSPAKENGTLLEEDEMDVSEVHATQETKRITTMGQGDSVMPQTDCESTFESSNGRFTSDTELRMIWSSPITSKRPKHRPPSPSSLPTPEKHSRGITRFFSKGKTSL